MCALVVNVMVTSILPPLMLAGGSRMALVYGEDSQARRILACLYGSICVVSAFALVSLLGWQRADVAIAVAQTLFPLQIVYKLATLVAVGWHSPVVKANLVIVVLLLLALADVHAA
ncbi:MAG: hypothetical protein AAF648_10025 [Pseudomonadota bacterium]